MNRRSLWLALMLALMSALMLVACAPTPAATDEPEVEETDAPEVEATDEPEVEETEVDEEEEVEETEVAPAGDVDESVSGSVVLWHAYGTGSAEEETLNGLIEDARAHFPNLEIEVLQVPFDQIFNKYQNEVAAGGGPDMYVAPNDDLGNWVRGDFVQALGDLVTDEDLAGVSETGVAGMEVDGELYGIPESAKAVALYYNKSLVETPATNADELLAQAEAGVPMTMFIGAYHMFGWPAAFGGELLDDTNTCVADQGGWVDALDYLLALKEAGVTFTGDYAQAEGPFRAGETAYFVNGPWALGDYKADLGDDLGVIVLEDFAPLNGIDGFYVNPNSENQEAAVALGLYLSTGERAQSYTDNAGHVPIREDVVSDDELVAAFAEASAAGFPRPQSKEFGSYWTPFGEMFTKVIEGAATPDEAVAEACAAMNAANEK